MSKHLNPLEKEFLIRQYKSNYRIKMSDFCEANRISTGAFQKWIKQYDEGGLEGLARADSEIKDVLPEGIDRTEESYKREILKLRIENERLKKTMSCRRGILGNRNSLEGGTIRLHGKEIRNKTSREAIKNGFALLTEERRATGIFGIRDIKENIVISNLKSYLAGGFCLSDKKMKEDTDWAIQAMHIKTPSQSTQIRSLSGGNQQKVIIGRWLLTKPEVLLLDEPTRGIDVGAKYEIYQLILDLAKEGKGVIMVSSEMPELLGICDRILVMSGGVLVGEVDARNTSREEILTLAAKSSSGAAPHQEGEHRPHRGHGSGGAPGAAED